MMADYDRVTGVQTRWASFENPLGEKGAAGKKNNGAKGAAFEPLAPGEVKPLMDVTGSGVVNRIWMTISTEFHHLLDQVFINMYWDGEAIPAVSVPLGGFFCAPLKRLRTFESALFSQPEGRSFNCFIKMPFAKGARIELVNRSEQRIQHIFYDINYQLCPIDEKEIWYFHSLWREERPALCEDYTILPTVSGEGRYLGQCIGVRVDPHCGTMWFGEGEFKVYLDGDEQFPTLCGSGTEDYIGTAWGQGEFSNMTQGCTIADAEKREYTFYRFHTVDPIYFSRDIRVAIQDIGGGTKANVLRAMQGGAQILPISMDEPAGFRPLYDGQFTMSESVDDGWYNHYRRDTFCSCAYFYLNKPDGDAQ